MKLDYQNAFLGEKSAEALKGKTVTVVGVGGLGSVVAEMLTRAGLNLRIIDKERVYVEDLPRQALYTNDELQKFKAKQIKVHLEKINPNITVKTFHEDLAASHVFLVNSDLVIDCTNYDKVSPAIAAHCKKQKIPYVVGVYSGSEGIVLASSTIPSKITAAFEKLKAEKGVLGVTTHYVGSLVVAKALKILTGQKYKKTPLKLNAWTMTAREIK
ncbi:MAG: ThiF family adenylyltransferase [Candidatus Woesearchaeota archaeon]